MSENDWLTWWDAFDLLSWCEDDEARLSERKLRLFAVACCRTIWPLLAEDLSRRAVKVAEAFADDQTSQEELQAVRSAAEVARQNTQPAASGATPAREDVFAYGFASLAELLTQADFIYRHMAQDVADVVSGIAFRAAIPPQLWGTAEGEAVAMKVFDASGPVECDLVREIFCNPLRPVSVAPTWRTPQAIAIAQTVYDERQWQDLPLLADALEDAGCTDEAILSHCRGPGPHARGCWPVDLLLGKT
jgi:hypothetical protein